MFRVSIALFFLVIAGTTYGQYGSTPIFEQKTDSIAYAQLERLLDPIINKARETENFGLMDSAFIARSKFLDGKAFFFRTVFQQDRAFTHFQDLPKIVNKDSITKISVLGRGRRKLPDSLYLYRNLADLELIDFKLRKFPRKMRVKRLTLYNNFPSKPLRFRKNSTITNLVIRGDEQGRLPKKYNKLKALQVMKLARNDLKVFPNLEGCNNLVLLDLSNNSIEKIPPGIEKLTHLESLSLYKNDLNELPDVLYTMRSLRVIDLYYNHIKIISPAIANWKNLEILYLANNEVYSVPNEIGELMNLKELYLHHNKLSNLPASIGKLTSLYTLRINNNGMIEWPEGLSRLKGLTNFDCSFNQFETLPITDLDFRNMKILSIGGNPWDPDLRSSINAWVIALRENDTVVHLDDSLAR